jgi:hypothetical protein
LFHFNLILTPTPWSWLQKGRLQFMLLNPIFYLFYRVLIWPDLRQTSMLIFTWLCIIKAYIPKHTLPTIFQSTLLNIFSSSFISFLIVTQFELPESKRYILLILRSGTRILMQSN